MERSRLRTLLGLALVVIGVVSLSNALVRSFAYAPPEPALAPMPAMPALPALPAVPEMPALPGLPALPELPPLPPMPAIPPAPPVPPAPPFFHTGFWISPLAIVFGIVVLLLWWRRRSLHDRPMA